MADSLLDGDNHAPTEDREAIIAKWKDKPQEELLNAKAESDLYVKTLTARLDDLKKDYLQLRDQHQASTDLSSLIDQMKSMKSEVPPQTPSGDTNTAIQIKPEDIEAMVRQHISANDAAKQQANNFNAVQERLKQTFGPDYQTSYKQRLDTLGLTKEFADDLAKNHPAVFYKTFELDAPAKSSPTSIPSSQRRPASFAPHTPKRDWNYYQNLKKENPRLYLDPKIAIQMHDDAIALGADFGMPED